MTRTPIPLQERLAARVKFLSSVGVQPISMQALCGRRSAVNAGNIDAPLARSPQTPTTVDWRRRRRPWIQIRHSALYTVFILSRVCVRQG